MNACCTPRCAAIASSVWFENVCVNFVFMNTLMMMADHHNMEPWLVSLTVRPPPSRAPQHTRILIKLHS